MIDFQPIRRPPGDFQQSLTRAELTAVAGTAFGSDTAVVAAQELGAGLFNNTYLLQTSTAETFILRVAPRDSAAVFTHERHLLQREQALEPPLRQVLPNLVPQTLLTHFSRQVIDRDYVIQTCLPGLIWDSIRTELPPADDEALWRQLAEIAHAIHQVAGAVFGLPAPEAAQASWSDTVLLLTRMMRDNLRALRLSTEGIAPFIRVLEAGRPLLDALTVPRLVHGDLWPKNVLIDHTTSPPRITGLLDAERGFWGDPLAEWIFYFLDIPDAFWEVYGRPSAAPATRFRQFAAQGQFLVQLLLEADRFSWDAEAFRQQLHQIIADLTQILDTV